eukprot:11726577-Alexandrium_andersonii.AAC.1
MKLLWEEPRLRERDLFSHHRLVVILTQGQQDGRMLRRNALRIRLLRLNSTVEAPKPLVLAQNHHPPLDDLRDGEKEEAIQPA